MEESKMNKEDLENKFTKLKQKASLKAWEIKNDLGEKCEKTVDWCLDHPKEALTIGCAIAGVGKTVYDWHTKNQLEKRVWDPHYGTYIPVRRKMTFDEKIEFRDRCKLGEDPRKVLTEMRLFK